MVDTLETTPTFDKPLGGRMGRKAAKVPLKGQDLAERKFARKLIFPALVVAILITQIPFIATIYYSFQDWNLARPEERSFAGFQNYVAVITNGAFLPSVWATVRIVGGSMILSLLLGLFPVLWMIVTSFKTEGQAASFPPEFFFTPTLDRYAAVFERGMGLYLLNSLFVAVLSTVVVMPLAIPAAYALSVRPIGRWQDGLFFFISTKFLPVAASIIPVFLLLRSVNLLDNLWSLGLLYLGINLPLAVWMMRSFFAEVPRAVVEAAQIDGASYNRELWRVSLPIVAPGAAAAALICFIFAWNEYFLANLLTAVVARTTPPFLGSFVDGRGQFLAILSAASTIAVLPVIVAGWLAQKRLVRGLAMGAVK